MHRLTKFCWDDKYNQTNNQLLGCPRKLGSMVSKWVISPTYKWGIPWGGKNPLIRSPLVLTSNGTSKCIFTQKTRIKNILPFLCQLSGGGWPKVIALLEDFQSARGEVGDRHRDMGRVWREVNFRMRVEYYLKFQPWNEAFVKLMFFLVRKNIMNTKI